MAMPEIVWTAHAERDLLDIYQQLFHAASEDDSVTDKYLERPLDSALRLLLGHPEIGPRVKGSRILRRWLLGPKRRYGLFYAIEQRGILIHALLDLRQNPEVIWKRLRSIGEQGGM